LLQAKFTFYKEKENIRKQQDILKELFYKNTF